MSKSLHAFFGVPCSDEFVFVSSYAVRECRSQLPSQLHRPIQKSHEKFVRKVPDSHWRKRILAVGLSGETSEEVGEFPFANSVRHCRHFHTIQCVLSESWDRIFLSKVGTESFALIVTRRNVDTAEIVELSRHRSIARYLLRVVRQRGNGEESARIHHRDECVA